MVRRKIEIIKKESGCSTIYIRNFIKRHPDVFMKSIGSLEAKINYISRTLNRQLKNERAFPLVLIYNYNQVIRPRGDLLKEKVNHFELDEAFFGNDKNFCKRYNVDMEDLVRAKEARKRTNDEEKDYLWSYVHLM